jgi:hypothetical protein
MHHFATTTTGEVLLHTSDALFCLKDVLYIPEATENLISFFFFFFWERAITLA